MYTHAFSLVTEQRQQPWCPLYPLPSYRSKTLIYVHGSYAVPACCAYIRSISSRRYNVSNNSVCCLQSGNPPASHLLPACCLHRISIKGLKTFAPGKPLTLEGKRLDGTTYSFPVNHTFNENQVRAIVAGRCVAWGRVCDGGTCTCAAHYNVVLRLWLKIVPGIGWCTKGRAHVKAHVKGTCTTRGASCDGGYIAGRLRLPQPFTNVL